MRASFLWTVGVVLLIGACAPIPVRDAAAVRSAPAAERSSTRFGFRLVSGPAPVENGQTLITVAADRELTLLAFMSKKDDAGGKSAFVPVEPAGTRTWTLRPVFPEAATWIVTLTGKPVEDSGDEYSLLAEWTVEADSSRVADAAADQSGAGSRSGWFTEYSTLNEYGLTVVEAPKENIVGPETLIVVSSDQDLELSAAVWRPGSNISIGGMTSIEKIGGTWRCRVAFPESGEFRVTLSVRRPGASDPYYTGAAEWRLHAEVKPGERVTLPPAGPPPAIPGRQKTAGPDSPAVAARTALDAAVADHDIPGVKSRLEACTSRDALTRRVSMDALKSVLFGTDPDRTPEVLGLLEAAGLDPNMADQEGWALLHSSVMSDRIDVASWLLEHGADVNARGRRGSTVLHCLSNPMDNPVAPEKHADWIELFVRYGVDLDAQNANGDTALCYAALSDRQHKLLVALVEHGADFDIGNNEGNAPLSHAWQHAAVKNREYLRARGARLYSYEFPAANDAAACRAILSGDLAAVASIPLEALGRTIARTSLLVPATPLHLAAEQGSLRVVRALCARKVDWNVPDRYGRSPLQLAVMAGRGDVVALLLDCGADPNFASLHRATPFTVACALNPPIARQMLARGVTPRGDAVARAAVGSEDLELLKALDGRIEWDSAALRFAADTGLVEATEYLARQVGATSGSPSQPISRAREARRRFQEYRDRAARPLEAPRRSGGIAEKRGTFPYVVESWSPWLPEGKADLADCPVGVYVPRSYDGKRPFGLVVSMTNAKSSSNYPRDFAATLDRHDLIWVGFDPYKSPGRDIAEFCLAIVYNMLGYYNIDQSRIYIGGFSLGGQLTEHVLRRQAWAFDGAFFINISYTGGPQSEPEWMYCKHHVPIVYVEGDYDYNRAWTYREYDELLCGGYRKIHYVHEPMKGHKLISSESFETIIGLLDAASGRLPGR